MPPRRIYFDKTEIICTFLAGRQYRSINLTYADIQRIQISPITERSLFRRIPSEEITIVTGRRPEPIVYRKNANRQYWDEYRKGFTKFAEQNAITFVDETSG